MRWLVNRRARRGAKLLDEREGSKWAARIVTDTLDMRSARRCVLGQLYGDYHRARTKLDLSKYGVVRYGFLCSSGVVRYGLLCSSGDGSCTCEQLRVAWIAEIKKRRPPVADQGASQEEGSAAW